MRQNVWLSIDWDYFVKEKESWEFGHAELPDFRDRLWSMRVAEFASRGRDLVEETSLKHSSPHPSRFWKQLKRLGYRFDNVQAVVVGDSHQWGHDVFRRSTREGPALKDTRIVHFDAHHDLTYDINRFYSEVSDGRVTCENWLLMTHLSQLGLESLIVYPEWKGLRDWERTFGKHFSKCPELKRALQIYTKPCVWPDRLVKEAAGDVELVYLCRSSPWCPPWHDLAFIEFAQDLQSLTRIPLVTPFTDLEKVDPLVPRAFDLSQALTSKESEKLYISRLINYA